MSFRLATWRYLLLWFLLAGLVRPGFAHTTGLSTSDLRFTTNGLEAEVILAGADLALALAHLEAEIPGDQDHDGKWSAPELEAALQRARQFAAACLAVEFDGQAVSPGPVALSLDATNNFHATLSYAGARPAQLRVRASLFARLPPDHLHFVAVHDVDGTKLGDKMLRPEDAVLEIPLAAAGAKPLAPRSHTFADFLKLGVEHIWTGYDHLLFLFALLLVCGTFKSAVQVVTCFTVAHSLTLAFATLNLVWVSGRVVEPAIAASIVFIAGENLLTSGEPKGRWVITFLFGLIHGFGFASVLKDLGVASGTTGVTVPLVAFNLGVEAGQVVVAAIVLPLMWRLKRWRQFERRGVIACSVIVAGVGAYWLVQRVFLG